MSEPSDRILAALISSEPLPCSGETLSEQLGVSRAQIWKHINQLRKRGYQIDGEAGGESAGGGTDHPGAIFV